MFFVSRGLQEVLPMSILHSAAKHTTIEVSLSFQALAVHRGSPLPGIRLSNPQPYMSLISERPRIVMIENFLTPQECQAMMGLAEPRLQASRVSTGSTTSFRTSSSTFLLDKMATHPAVMPFERRVTKLLSLLGPLAPRALHKTEAVQVVRYNKGEYYAEHFDNRAGNCGLRAATLMVYLSDVPSGGATHFPRSTGCRCEALDALDCFKDDAASFTATTLPRMRPHPQPYPGLRIQPKQGRAILFWSRLPSGEEDSCSLHSAERVRRGEKWIATRWLSDLEQSAAASEE
ncbi:hypothetical protein WJX72_002399 [[Myrmecia] bisecta]|uniref:Fe2OG dioxygenase domain-containing protein n=1 Tax=[Myrmecia] bisecta TaxID=41462 RepID=A0AAW1PMW6_9CHLO